MQQREAGQRQRDDRQEYEGQQERVRQRDVDQDSSVKEQGGGNWSGYVVPYRYYGPGYRGVGYYSVLYQGRDSGDATDSRRWDESDVQYGEVQGAGAAWQEGGTGRRRERGDFTGRGPKGYQRSDERLKEEVSDRMMADHRIDASEIEVQVKNAEVTLTGTVEDRWTKRLAEDIAEQVMGVRDVMNQIRVESETGGAMSGSRSDAARSSAGRGRTTSEQPPSNGNRRTAPATR